MKQIWKVKDYRNIKWSRGRELLRFFWKGPEDQGFYTKSVEIGQQEGPWPVALLRNVVLQPS